MSEGTGRDRRNYAPRPLRRRPVVTPAEQQRLWDARLVWYPRELLVLALLLEAGLRPRGLCALTFHDLQPPALSLPGKHGRARPKPIGNQTTLPLDPNPPSPLPLAPPHFLYSPTSPP